MAKDVAAVALLGDLVGSRATERTRLHEAVVAAAEDVNLGVASLSPLTTTVGDELQGVYPTLGAALEAAFSLRLALAPRWEVRFGLGGGELRVIDAERGIQDGSAWWSARDALEWVEEQAGRKGYASARTAIRDGRERATPQADAMVRLVDASLARLRDGGIGTLSGMWEGLDNAETAKREGISDSANSQRVINNDLRPLLDAMRALTTLP